MIMISFKNNTSFLQKVISAYSHQEPPWGALGLPKIDQIVKEFDLFIVNVSDETASRCLLERFLCTIVIH